MFYVIANDAPSEVKNAAALVIAAGYPVWQCDGTADDIQIQAALDAMTAGRTWKEKVVLIGSFTISTRIEISDSYTIFDSHQAKLTLTDKANDIVIVNSGVSHVDFISGIYDGLNAGTYTDDNYAVIRINGTLAEPCEDIWLIHPRFQNCYNNPLLAAYVKGLFVTDYECDNANQGLMIWVSPVDVATFDGFSSVQGARIQNINGNAIDGTIANGAFSHVRVIGDSPISIDNFRNLTYSDVITDGSINNLVGDYATDHGSCLTMTNCIAKNVIEVKNYSSGDLENVTMSDVQADQIQLLIEGSGNINHVEINNPIVSGGLNAGVYANRAGAGSGSFNKVLISSIDTKDHAHRGVEIHHANYVQVVEGVAENNPDVGMGFYDCNEVILNGYQAIKGTTQGYAAEFDTVDSVILDNAWADQQTTGGYLFINVTKRTIGKVDGHYLFKNSGTSAIASGATTKVIAHGLAETPTLDEIRITWGEQGTSDYGRWWVDTIGAANFTVNVSADPGASNLDFGWHIHIDK